MDPKTFLVVAKKFIVAQIGSTGLKPYSIVVTSTLAWCSRDSRLMLLLVLLGLLLLLIAGCVVLMWRHHGNDKDGGNIIIVQPANVTETERPVVATLQRLLLTAPSFDYDSPPEDASEDAPESPSSSSCSSWELESPGGKHTRKIRLRRRRRRRC